MRDHIAWGGEQAPLGDYEWDYARIVLMKSFHWPPEVVDHLSHGEVNRIFSVLAGISDGEEMKHA